MEQVAVDKKHRRIAEQGDQRQQPPLQNLHRVQLTQPPDHEGTHEPRATGHMQPAVVKPGYPLPPFPLAKALDIKVRHTIQTNPYPHFLGRPPPYSRLMQVQMNLARGARSENVAAGVDLDARRRLGRRRLEQQHITSALNGRKRFSSTRSARRAARIFRLSRGSWLVQGVSSGVVLRAEGPRGTRRAQGRVR